MYKSESLTVYKASAGSGKTFRLSLEFIKLLIDNPYSYDSILAVTFTNKATEEMKLRILSHLYGIWKQLPDSKDYMDKTTKELNISQAFASSQAKLALENLLHNYNYFRVETIDSFFQSVLRNLARELDLTANLRVELNDKQTEQKAVDELIDGLDSKSLILDWILKYIKNNISEDKSWNVIGSIKKFGENIFNDVYKEYREDMLSIIDNPVFLKNYYEKLKSIIDESSKNMINIGKMFLNIIEKNNLSVDDFAFGNSGIYGYFFKLSNGTFDDSIFGARIKSCIEDSSKWYSKGNTNKDILIPLIESNLLPLLKHSEEIRHEQWRLFQSSKLTFKHIYQIRLLSSIEKKVRDINDETNQFLLSDTQTLLHKLINNSDSTFIYEKIGTRINHIMIDEFQDTSTVQWQNFKVLLNECMSHNTGNLIVGDVKQSIYRWRSGDWRLLNNIEEQFPPIMLKQDKLDTNYRSERKIINFNNIFFKLASQIEYDSLINEKCPDAEQLTKAYEDLKQQIPDKKDDKGFVDIELLDDDDYENNVLLKTKEFVTELLYENGVNAEDIAILVRYNKDIPVIADYFMREMPEVNIVSDEAFRLDASLSVNMIVKALYLLIHQDDILSKAYLIKTYQKNILKSEKEDIELLKDIDSLDALLPYEYVNNTEELLNLPIYDLAEKLYSIFSLSELKNQGAYICYFFDKLNDYLNDNPSDIDSFIKEWNDNLHSKTIQQEKNNGIRLISIHKSKGLEFDNVIIPFCDWQIEKNGDLLWCNPTVAPFNEMPIIPIDYYSSQMKGTIYEKDYLKEHLQNCVDNINLLYVAFTRAGKNLMVIGKNKSNKGRSVLIEKTLKQIKEELTDCDIEGIDNDKAPEIIFKYGTLCISSKKDKGNSKNVFLQKKHKINLEIKSFNNKAEFLQSNKSKDFINEEDAELKQNQYITLGNILHQLFSHIHTIDDIDTALKQLEFDGVLYNEFVTPAQLSNIIHERLSDDRVRDWFSHKWEIFNECTILTYDKKINKTVDYRPDRVMVNGNDVVVVDFKFGKENVNYKKQLKNYMNLLCEMGYNNVKGFLWFVYNNVIVEVK